MVGDIEVHAFAIPTRAVDHIGLSSFARRQRWHWLPNGDMPELVKVAFARFRLYVE